MGREVRKVPLGYGSSSAAVCAAMNTRTRARTRSLGALLALALLSGGCTLELQQQQRPGYLVGALLCDWEVARTVSIPGGADACWQLFADESRLLATLATVKDPCEVEEQARWIYRGGEMVTIWGEPGDGSETGVFEPTECK